MIIHIAHIRELVGKGEIKEAKRTLFLWVRNQEIGMATFSVLFELIPKGDY